jgi:hypothetical protein
MFAGEVGRSAKSIYRWLVPSFENRILRFGRGLLRFLAK